MRSAFASLVRTLMHCAHRRTQPVRWDMRTPFRTVFLQFASSLGRTTWSTFLKAHWKVLAASDFLTVEVWTGRGLVTHYLLFVISLADRVVKIAGITTDLTNRGCFRLPAT